MHMEGGRSSNGVVFRRDATTMARLKLPSRFKGEGMRSQVNMRNPTLLEALMDSLPIMVDITNDRGEVIKGYYAQ